VRHRHPPLGYGWPLVLRLPHLPAPLTRTSLLQVEGLWPFHLQQNNLYDRVVRVFGVHPIEEAEMASVGTYLNFMGNADEAFNFYAEVFGTSITSIMRIGDMPPMPGGPELSDAEKQLIMNVQMPILAGHVLMATDMIASMGHEVRIGNNTTINLELDTRDETDRIYTALAEGGDDCSPLADMFWGSYWGTCLDRFGIRWMFNCYQPAA
jgi:PhnB protein